MEENKNEEVVEETTQETTEQVDESKFESAGDDSVAKVDLSNPPKQKEDEQSVDNTETEEVQKEVVKETTSKEEVIEQSTEEDTETPVLEEITDEEVEEKVDDLQEQVEEAVAEAKATGKEIPENIQKLMDFMEETGGDLEDYVKLNQDYSKLDNKNLLYEYYRQTKPQLDNEEINFLMEDQFSYY